MNVDEQADRSTRRMSRAHHPRCFACAENGLSLRFVSESDGSVCAQFNCPATCQSYPDRLHGGIVATLVDAAMTHCLFAHGIAGLTTKLEVTFRHPVLIDQPAVVRGWLEIESGLLHVLRAEVRQKDKVCALAMGLFIQATKTKKTGQETGREAQGGCPPPETGNRKPSAFRCFDSSL